MNFAEITFISVIVIVVAFYLVTIWPAQREQKRQQQAIRDLQVGDEVITTSGFFAHIKEIHTPEKGDVQLILDLGNGLEVRALTSAIIRRVTEEETVEGPEGQTKGA